MPVNIQRLAYGDNLNSLFSEESLLKHARLIEGKIPSHLPAYPVRQAEDSLLALYSRDLIDSLSRFFFFASWNQLKSRYSNVNTL